MVSIIKSLLPSSQDKTSMVSFMRNTHKYRYYLPNYFHTTRSFINTISIGNYYSSNYPFSRKRNSFDFSLEFFQKIKKAYAFSQNLSSI